MDTLTHGLWGGLAAGWKKRFGLAFLFGIAPDMCSFGALMVIRIVQRNFVPGKPQLATIPDWLNVSYNLGHSLVVVGAVWLILWFVARTVAIPFLAWPLHILCDIPTHTQAYFPTPFLYPLSSYTYDGFSWAQNWFMIANYTGLLILALCWIYFRHRRRTSKGTHRKRFMLKDPLASAKVQAEPANSSNMSA